MPPQQEAKGMFHWIIEADIYRLQKAAGEETDGKVRRELQAIAEHKLAVLETRRGKAAGRASQNA
jgi:hypothetical protein